MITLIELEANGLKNSETVKLDEASHFTTDILSKHFKNLLVLHGERVAEKQDRVPRQSFLDTIDGIFK